MTRPVIISALAIVAALTGGTQHVVSEPLMVKVQQIANGCDVTLNGVHVTYDVLLKSAKRQRGRRAIIAFGKDEPYKCVGAAIIKLQQAGIMEIEPIPSPRN